MLAFSRRQFLMAAAAVGGGALLPVRVKSAGATPTALRVVRRSLEVQGRAAEIFAILQPDGSHGLTAAAGDRFRVALANELAEPTLVHWHGLTPPSAQDGVPDLSQPAIQPGASYDYDFVLARPGTYWMHSHVGLQEQQLLAAPLIIRDPAEAGLDDQEVVIMLHDFSFRDPAEIYADLTGGKMPMDHGGMSSMSSDDTGTVGGMEMSGMDHGAAMPGMDMHLNDVEYDAYLANDRTLDDPEVVRVERGGRVRLRIINGSSSTNFHIDLGALEGRLVAVDGHAIQPVSGRRFPLAIAQRADIRLSLPGSGAWPILAVREGDTAQTGIILASKDAAITRLTGRAAEATVPLDLALESGLKAAIPLPARPAERTHRVELGGGMMPFVWTLNGKRFGADTPLPVKAGERVEMLLVNRTSMAHPMHLHGHVFQVAAIGDQPVQGALRDTVLVPAGGRVAIAFDADNPGHWAFHCHNLYHMQAGMMTSVKYES
jgi:FtsP/CotA-like multicopper oxidase with cupredoxin domain